MSRRSEVTASTTCGPNAKVKKSEKAVEVLCAVLARDSKAIVTKWAPRGRELLVAIYPKDGALLMQSLMYEPQVRAPRRERT